MINRLKEARKALSLFENNHRLPKLDMVEKLAKLYEVNPAWLVGWSDEK